VGGKIGDRGQQGGREGVAEVTDADHTKPAHLSSCALSEERLKVFAESGHGEGKLDDRRRGEHD